MTAADTPRLISLIDSLTEKKWIKLPIAVMRDVGPAAQALGGILKITKTETFVAVSGIAEKARLPLATVRKHLVTLEEHGWIRNEGRQRTRTGRPRRTCTLKLTKQSLDAMKSYNFLPLWACDNITNVGRLPWSSKALLSVIMSRLLSLKAVADEVERNRTPDELHKRMMSGQAVEPLSKRIRDIGGYHDMYETRYRFSLRALCEQTGLERQAVISAKQHLHRLKIIKLYAGIQGEANPVPLLVPDDDFRVIETPLGNGTCRLAFGRCETGH